MIAAFAENRIRDAGAGDAQLVFRPPTVAEYARLRASVGWSAVDEASAAAGLANALFSVCLVLDGRTIGCGRVVGDGGIFFYVQDIVVLPEFHGRGYGARIMDAVIGYLGRAARPGAFVGLMAAKGAAGFYERYGFVPRPPDRPGMYLIWPELTEKLSA